uniref:Uncharacterized protein n=1 Tax=Cannabis sativa TaxID=3483 RepID=A0A803P688_CANSA
MVGSFDNIPAHRHHATHRRHANRMQRATRMQQTTRMPRATHMQQTTPTTLASGPLDTHQQYKLQDHLLQLQLTGAERPSLELGDH